MGGDFLPFSKRSKMLEQCWEQVEGDTSPLLNTGEKHLKHWVQFCFPLREDEVILERVQHRPLKTMKGLEHPSYEERLRELDNLAWRRADCGIFSMWINTFVVVLSVQTEYS